MKEMDEKGDQYFINTYKSKQYVFDLVRRVFNGSDTWRVSTCLLYLLFYLI